MKKIGSPESETKRTTINKVALDSGQQRIQFRVSLQPTIALPIAQLPYDSFRNITDDGLKVLNRKGSIPVNHRK
jgi:hypothetical protein